MRPRRLVGLASILIDRTLAVPALPPRGGDVIAEDLGPAAGGGINALVAAARLGLATVYAGRHGSGPHGELVREALRREGISCLTPATPDRDTGWCLALVEPDGERTFVTAPGAEAVQDAASLAGIALRPDDAVYVSGYDLVYPDAGPALATWLAALPREAAGGPWVVVDPGPLVGEVDPARLRAVVARADLVTVSAAESAVIAALPPPRRLVIRHGADGAELRCADGAELRVPGTAPPGPVIDTNGAGDTHLGAMLAARSDSLDWRGSLTLANRAAAFAITRRGAASGPTRLDLGLRSPSSWPGRTP